MLALALFAGIFIGYQATGRVMQGTLKGLLSQHAQTLADDRSQLLGVLRRELANVLIGRDPDSFLRIYRDVHTEAARIPDLKPEAQQELLNDITTRFPYYRDFDLLAAREHVLYTDAASFHGDEELERHYRDLSIFHALKCATDEAWKYKASHTAQDMEHLEKYLGEIKDAKLSRRIKEAMREWRTFLDAHENSFDVLSYETDALSVRRLPHIVDIRYGVHFRDSNEYGLCSAFVGDDGRVFRSFYRSDASFEKEEALLERVRLEHA